MSEGNGHAPLIEVGQGAAKVESVQDCFLWLMAEAERRGGGAFTTLGELSMPISLKRGEGIYVLAAPGKGGKAMQMMNLAVTTEIPLGRYFLGLVMIPLAPGEGLGELPGSKKL